MSSRRPKLDYDFCPMPRRRHAAWAGASLFETGLRDRLFELHDGGPITVDGPWEESLCKQAAVNGPERSMARRILRKWRDRGLVSVSSNTVTVVFRATDQLAVNSQSTSSQLTVNSQSTPGQLPVNSESTFDSTPRNNSNHVGETDRQTEETDETDTQTRERARELGEGVGAAEVVSLVEPRSAELDGYRWLQAALGSTPPDLGTWRREYATIASKPASERAAVARNALATPYIAAKRSKATPGHLLKFWAQFVEGPRTFEFDRPAIAKRFAGPSRVATEAEYAADAAGGNDPW
jgi:hypothetical protein